MLEETNTLCPSTILTFFLPLDLSAQNNRNNEKSVFLCERVMKRVAMEKKTKAKE